MRFWKYQGLGNDFVIVEQPVAAARVRELCDRRQGIGADGFLILSSDPDPDLATRVLVTNADGSDAGMCGNGLRCVARYLYDSARVPADEPEVRVAMGEGTYRCERLAADRFRVHLPAAVDDHPDLPAATEGREGIAVPGASESWQGSRLWLGNPHLVIIAPDAFPQTLAQRHGAELSAWDAFRSGVNVTFARATPEGFEAATHERGVGLTLACGSAACAVASAAVRRGDRRVGEVMTIALPGGALEIAVAVDGEIAMTGHALRVFAGEVEP